MVDILKKMKVKYSTVYPQKNIGRDELHRHIALHLRLDQNDMLIRTRKRLYVVLTQKYTGDGENVFEDGVGMSYDDLVTDMANRILKL